MMGSKILLVKFVYVFKNGKHEFIRFITVFETGDSKVQIHSGSNSGFKDFIFDNFLINSSD